ncbi:unnamed protein product, partial [Phaeothamnion confervicola]
LTKRRARTRFSRAGPRKSSTSRRQFDSFLPSRCMLRHALPAQLWHCRVTYFFLFAAIGAIGPFLPLIFEHKGLSGRQIGVLSATVPLASIPCAPVLCAAADCFRARRATLLACLAIWGVLQCIVEATDTFGLLFLATLLMAVVRAPVTPLVDAACMAAATAEHSYGDQRLWGAIGFGVMTFLGGGLADAEGGYSGVFMLFAALVACTFAAVRGLSIDGARRHGNNGGSGGDKGGGRGGGGEGGEEKEQEEQERESCGGVEMGAAAGRAAAKLSPTSSCSEEEGGGEHETELEDCISQMVAPRRHHKHGRSFMVQPDRGGGDGGGGGSGGGVCGEDSEEGDSGDFGASGDADDVPIAASEAATTAPPKLDAAPDFGAAARHLLGDPDIVAVFFIVTLSGAWAGIIDTFLFVRLDELGGSGTLLGLARAIMCAAEVPVFQVTGRVIDRWGVKAVLAAAQVAYIMRFTYYALLTNPWMVLPVEVLHGITFAALWNATTAFAHAVAPPGMQSTLQGIATTLHWGVGFGCGAVGGGVLYQRTGAVLTFGLGAVLATGSFLLAMASIAARGARIGGGDGGGG